MLDLSQNFELGNNGFEEKSLQELPDEFDFSISSELTYSSIETSKAYVGLSVKVHQTNSKTRPVQFKFADKTHTQIIYSISGDRELGLIKGVFEFTFDARHQYLFASQHPKNALLKDCVLKDLSAFPVMYNQLDLEQIQKGQVIGLTLDRGAELGMEFSWSNIISRSISGLTGLGVDPKTISLDIKPSLFVNFKYALDDSLLLLARKSKGDLIEFAVTKANQKQADINAGVKVNLKLSDNKVFQELLDDTGDQLIEAMLDTKLQHLDALLNDATQTKENLKTHSWYPILEKLMDLDNLEIPDIRGKLETVKSDIIKKIQTAISRNTELAIRYEYRKTETQNEVLHFDLPLNKIQHYHPSLMNFKLSEIIENFRDENLPQILFHQYLNQKTLTVKRSLGLGLTLFDKNLFNVRGKENTKQSITENLEGHQSIHYQVGSGYEGNLGNWSSKWYSEITLDMDGFSKAPSFQEADISQYLSQSSGIKIKKLEDLQILLDTGVIWGAILPEQRNKLAKSLFPELKNQTIEIQSTIVLHGEGFNSFLNQFTALAKISTEKLQGKLARSLALSILYLPQNEVRRDINIREMAYKEAFVNLLKSPGISKTQLVNIVAEDILKINPKSKDYQSFSRMEKEDLPSSFLHILSKNQNIAEKWNAVGSLYSNLAAAISSNSPIIGKFEKIDNDIRQIPSASIHCRALGALLNHFAQRNPVIEKHTVRTVEIFPERGNTIVFLFCAGIF